MRLQTLVIRQLLANQVSAAQEKWEELSMFLSFRLGLGLIVE